MGILRRLREWREDKDGTLIGPNIEADSVDAGSVNTEYSRSTNFLAREKDKSVSNSSDIRNQTFNVVGTWRDTLPQPGTPADNLVLSRTNFRGNLFGAKSNLPNPLVTEGSASSKSISAGELTISNSTGSVSEELIGLRTTPSAPYFAARLRVESYSATLGSSAANQVISYQKDANNRIQVVHNVAQDRIEFFGVFNGDVDSQTLVSSGVQAPFDLLVLFGGNRVDVFTAADGADWEFQGGYDFSGNGVNLHQRSEISGWEIGFGYRIDDGESLTVSSHESMISPGVGVRDMTAVTYRDGAPFIKDDKAYFTATVAGNSIGSSYQGIYALDLNNYGVRQTGALFTANTDQNDRVYGDHAGHLLFDQERGEWVWLTSGWVTTREGSDSTARTYVARTDDSPLHTVSVLESEDTNLPGSDSGHTYDPVAVYDQAADAWRCIHNKGGVDNIAITETTDDTFTSWGSTLGEYDGEGAGTTEGAKLTRVNDEFIALCGDEENEDFRVLDYPTLSNSEPLTVDTAPGHTQPHPTVMPVYIDGETRYVMLSMDKAKAIGMGDFSWGALYVYESETVADGYEWPIRRSLI